jgi:hypothetical protein
MALISSHAAITCRSLTGSATDATRGRDDAIVFTDHVLELLSVAAVIAHSDHSIGHASSAVAAGLILRCS